MNKKMSLIASMCLCLILCLTVSFSSNAEVNTTHSKNEINLVQPHSIMHLSHTVTDDKVPVSVTFVYGYQESTNQIFGIDRAYISAYNTAVIEDCYVNDWGWYSEYEGFYASVSYKWRGYSYYNTRTVSWFF